MPLLPISCAASKASARRLRKSSSVTSPIVSSFNRSSTACACEVQREVLGVELPESAASAMIMSKMLVVRPG